jgi:hypothetical protein
MDQHYKVFVSFLMDFVALTASRAYGDEGASLLLVTQVTVSTETTISIMHSKWLSY